MLLFRQGLPPSGMGNVKLFTLGTVFLSKAHGANKFPAKQMMGFLNNHLSHAIVAVSPAAAQNLTETGTNPNRIQVIFNGIKALEPLTQEERHNERKRLGLLDKDFVCAMMVRLETVKGIDYVLQASAMLQKNEYKY